MAPQTNRIEFQLKQQQQQKTRHTDDVAKSDRGKQISLENNNIYELQNKQTKITASNNRGSEEW